MTSAATSAATAASARPKNVKALLAFKPTALSPLVGSASGNRTVEGFIYASLLKYDENLQLTPDFAEKWDVSPDAQQVTFQLRKGAKWSDGQPLTAEDVSFTLHLMLNKDSGSAQIGRMSVIKGAAEYTAGTATKVSGIEVVDPTTLRLTFTKPNYPFLIQLAEAAFVLPKHVLGSVPPKDLPKHQFFQSPTVGAGPYKFVKYEVDQFVELEANPEFVRGRPKIDRIFLNSMTGEVAVAQLEKGELDVASISPLDAARFERMADRQVLRAPGAGITVININNQQPHLKDKRVRQALVYALDRQSIVKTVLAGHATLTDTPFPGLDWALPSDLGKYTYDPEKARALLREAGWDSNRVLTLDNSSTVKDQVDMVPIVQAQWAAVGIKVNVNVVTGAAFLDRISKRSYDLFVSSGGRWGTDPDFASAYFGSNDGQKFYPNGNNTTFYSNKRVDELFAAGASTADRSARAKSYQELAKVLYDEVPCVWLYIPDSYYVVNKRLTGFKPNKDNVVFAYWNAEQWSVAD